MNRDLKRIRDARYRFNKRIRASNAAFKAMSPAEKRVQIAKDVLMSLDTGKLEPVNGSYMLVELPKYTHMQDSDTWETYDARQTAFKDLDAREQLLTGTISCSVCAIGAVFTCAVQRQNELTVAELQASRRGMVEYLQGSFSAVQLDLIECAFERTRDNMRCDATPYTDARLAEKFGHSVHNSWLDAPHDARGGLASCLMRAIMENIVANEGAFVP